MKVKIVLTVPMRNGNDAFVDVNVLQGSSSYRTYEEWKQRQSNEIYVTFIEFLPYL